MNGHVGIATNHKPQSRQRERRNDRRSLKVGVLTISQTWRSTTTIGSNQAIISVINPRIIMFGHPTHMQKPGFMRTHSRFPSHLLFPRRYRSQYPIVLILCLLIYSYYSLSRPSFFGLSRPDQTPLYCPHSHLAENILLVLRTGATQVPTKLPVHLTTTLRCVPSYAIMSDYEEDFLGHHIIDVLVNSSERLKQHPDFSVYHELRSNGRNGNTVSAESGSGQGGSDLPAWKLDRFKFLPTVEKAFQQRSDAQWYVFVELDTYLLWPNLLKHLEMFDSAKPYYLGREMAIGDVGFAYGGAGFALSRPAVERLLKYWHEHQDEYEEFAIAHWAGDAVLGKMLRDADIPLTWQFPNFQSDPLSSIPFDVFDNKRQPWCFAPSSYHHMNVEDIRQFWDFEQGWYRKSNRTLLHSDIFREWILPQFSDFVEDWDNLSKGETTGEDHDGSASFETCRTACEMDETCRQFSCSAGICSTSSEIRLGYGTTKRCLEYSFASSHCTRFAEGNANEEAARVSSGWMMYRIQQRMADMDRQCEQRNEGPWVGA